VSEHLNLPGFKRTQTQRNPTVSKYLFNSRSAIPFLSLLRAKRLINSQISTVARHVKKLSPRFLDSCEHVPKYLFGCFNRPEDQRIHQMTWKPHSAPSFIHLWCEHGQQRKNAVVVTSCLPRYRVVLGWPTFKSTSAQLVLLL
jgi:hypothetical protein